MSASRGGRITVSAEYLMKSLHLDDLDAGLVHVCMADGYETGIVLSVMGEDPRLPSLGPISSAEELPEVLVTLHQSVTSIESIEEIKPHE